MSGVAASVDVFRAVADPTRRALLDLLHQADRSVSELAQPFPMTQPAISQHLRILRRAGLVRPQRVGWQRLYRINPKPLQQVYDWAASYQQFTDPAGHVWALAGAKETLRRGRRPQQRVARGGARKAAGAPEAPRRSVRRPHHRAKNHGG